MMAPTGFSEVKATQQCAIKPIVEILFKVAWLQQKDAKLCIQRCALKRKIVNVWADKIEHFADTSIVRN